MIQTLWTPFMSINLVQVIIISWMTNYINLLASVPISAFVTSILYYQYTWLINYTFKHFTLYINLPVTSHLTQNKSQSPYISPYIWFWLYLCAHFFWLFHADHNGHIVLLLTLHAYLPPKLFHLFSLQNNFSTINAHGSIYIYLI